jgi:glycosyltransferase involved in cell wall biosynthesis
MVSPNLHILIVLPHLKCGGTERTASELANYIVEDGGNVTLLTMYKREKFYNIHPKVRLIEPDISKNKLGKYFYIFFLVIYLRTQFRKLKPDVIFALGYIAITLFSSLSLKTKVVMSWRSNPNRVRFPENRIINRLYYLSYWLMRKRVNGIIAQTTLAAKFFKKKYDCPIVIIPNFLRELKEYKVEKQNLIINVGHCTSDKAQYYLIKAFKLLNAPDWKLMIVGEGPKRKELEDLSISLGLFDRVIFTGYQRDIDLYLSKSSIFAFTSVIEGYPNALIEAMATPLPSVSFDCEAGPSDIIADGKNGFLVKVGDIETFANRLQELIDKPALRLKIQSEASVIKKHNDLAKIAPRYVDFFSQIAETS